MNISTCSHTKPPVVTHTALALLSCILITITSSATSSAASDPVKDLLPGHWYEIPDSKLSSVDPCPARNCVYSGVEGQSAVMDDWNGGAFDSTRNRLIVWGGGHQGYAGNEIYVFDVLGKRSWQRLSEPSKDVNCDQPSGLYPDQRPCAAHIYDYVDFHPGSDSFIKLGSASNYPEGGAGVGTVNLFSFATGEWRTGASRSLKGGLTGASSAYDSKRDVFWLLPAYDQSLAKFDPNTGADGKWTTYKPFSFGINAVSAIAPEQDLLVTLDSRSAHRVVVHDLANPGEPGMIVTTSGDKALESIQAAGFEWDPVLKKFVGWRGGTSVYTLDPANWAWTKINAAPTNTVDPRKPNSNGTYGRFRYMPELNAYIVVNRTSENVFVYRMADAPYPDQSATAESIAQPEKEQDAPPSGKISGGEAEGAETAVTKLADDLPPATTPLPTDSDENFLARAKAPGVVFFEGFDADAVVLAKRFPDARGGYDNVLYDTAQKASGEGSLQFVIPSSSPPNSSGAWRTNFSDDASIKFGAGDDLFIQWRQRFDAAMLNTIYTTTDGTNGGWKSVLIGEGDYPGFGYGKPGETSSCTTMHLVMNNYLQRHLPQLYHGCGHFQGLTRRFKENGTTYYKLQNAIDRGEHISPIQDRYVLHKFEPQAVTELRKNSPAAGFHPDEWMTFQIRISPGRLGTAQDSNTRTSYSGFTDSTVEMWVAREGQASIRTHSLTGLVLHRDDGAEDTDEKYGKIWFTPYQTNKDPAQVHPVGHTWIDELIVSRTRIQDP